FGSDVFSIGADSFSDGNGWASAQHYQTVRVVDVDGDGRADVCGRGNEGIYCQLSRSTGTQTSFLSPLLWVSNFGDNYGWGDSESNWGTVQTARLSIDPYTVRPVNGFCARGNAGIYCTDTVRYQADAAYDWSTSTQNSWNGGFASWVKPLVVGQPS